MLLEVSDIALRARNVTEAASDTPAFKACIVCVARDSRPSIDKGEEAPTAAHTGDPRHQRPAGRGPVRVRQALDAQGLRQGQRLLRGRGARGRGRERSRRSQPQVGGDDGQGNPSPTNTPFEVTLVLELGGFIRKREHALAVESCASASESDRATDRDLQRPTSSRRPGNSSDGSRVRNPAFLLAPWLGTLNQGRPRTRRSRVSPAAAGPISGRPRAQRPPRRGRRSYAAYYRWVDDVLRHRADG